MLSLYLKIIKIYSEKQMMKNYKRFFIENEDNNKVGKLQYLNWGNNKLKII